MKNSRSDKAVQRTQSDSRLHFWCMTVLLSYFFLAAALVLFQVSWSDRYVGLALKNRLRLIRMPPVRGQIYDRKGLPLAMNVMTFDIMGYPLDLKDKTLRDRLLAALERAHMPHAAEQLENRIKNRFWVPYRAVSLISNLTLLQMTGLMEDPDFPEELFPLPVWRRIYPAGPLASHVVGYVGEISEDELRQPALSEGRRYIGGDSIGKSGVEKQYEHLLRGEVGESAIEVDARGRRRRKLDEQLPGLGQDLRLTLDLGGQRCASELLGDMQGVMIALDVRSGEVLVLYSSPSYDPNPLAWGVSASEWAALNNDAARPMLNRAVSGQYSPGSIFKILSGYAALESGAVTKDTVINCPGVYKLGLNSYRCWARYGHGREKFVTALRDSCDVYFYETSQLVGINKYLEVGERVGLGRRLGIDLPGEAPGILAGPAWKKENRHEAWMKGDTVNMSIGQGFLLMTPLQMADMFATFANGGTVHKPHVLLGAPVESRDAGLREDYLKLIREGLQMVTAKGGTGRRAGEYGVNVAGKTGTVQNPHGKDHAVFVGFAPADLPKYAVLCFIEGGEGGGRVAAPLAGQLLAYLLGQDGGAKQTNPQ